MNLFGYPHPLADDVYRAAVVQADVQWYAKYWHLDWEPIWEKLLAWNRASVHTLESDWSWARGQHLRDGLWPWEREL